MTYQEIIDQVDAEIKTLLAKGYRRQEPKITSRWTLRHVRNEQGYYVEYDVADGYQRVRIWRNGGTFEGAFYLHLFR